MTERDRRPDPTASAPVGARVQRAPGKGTQVDATYGAVQRTAEQGVASGGEPLPFGDELRASFGRHAGALDGATAHVGGEAAAAAGAIGATAYATGNRIGFAEAPDRALVGHEAAHVVQQRAGVQLAGGVGAEGDPYERNADEVGAAFAAGRSAEALLDQFSGGGGTSAVQRQAAPASAPSAGPDFDTARDVMTVLGEVLTDGGLPIAEVDDHDRVVHVGKFPSGYDKLPLHWQVLIRDWWNLVSRTVRGDAALQQLDADKDATAPLIDELRAEIKHEEIDPWLAENYAAPVERVRAQAVQDAVADAITAQSQTAQGGALDYDSLGEVDQLALTSTSALAALGTVRSAVSTFAPDPKKLQQMNEALIATGVTPSAGLDNQLAKAEDIQAALGIAAGVLSTIGAVVKISDPKARVAYYRAELARLGGTVTSTDYMKDVGGALTGCLSLIAGGAYAVAQVAGKPDLATKALAVSKELSGAAGKIGPVLNAIGVVHGIAVLCNSNATPAERVDAGVEAGTGALGLAGKFGPALAKAVSTGEWVAKVAPWCTAASTAISLTYFSFKGLLEMTMKGYANLMRLGFNICYAHMKAVAESMSRQAVDYASALDLAGSFSDPDKAAALLRQTEGERWNLVNTLLIPFVAEAIAPGGNQAPGTYAVLQRRFAALGQPTLETPEATLGYTKALLEVIVSCFLDAQELFNDEVTENFRENG